MAGPSSVPIIRYDLAYHGLVSQVVNATSFLADGLAGHGNGAFQSYNIYVLKKADGTTTAPHQEQVACTAYTSATGLFAHAAFTASLAGGDEILLLHPGIGALSDIKTQIDKLAGETPGVGTTIENWQIAEANVVSVGANNVKNKLHSLLLDINALVGAVTVRMYMQINGIERRVYQQNFTVAADGPGLWIVNGTIGIHEVLRVTAQSDNAADNGQAICYDYMLEAM